MKGAILLILGVLAGAVIGFAVFQFQSLSGELISRIDRIENRLGSVESRLPTFTPTVTPTVTDTPTPTQTPTITPTPSFTPTPSITPSPTYTPSPTPTPTPDAASFTVGHSAVNVRIGPGVHFRIIGAIERGETFEPSGRNSIVDYWLEFDYNGQKGWTYSRYMIVVREDLIPIVPTPPTPTPTFTPTSTPVNGHGLRITVAAENRCSPYDPNDYSYSQSVEAQIVAQQGGHIYSPYSGRCFTHTGETDIEHIVARSEAHDSGLCAADNATRRAFANDLLNLTLASPGLNRHEKGAKDLAEWLPALNQCWYVNQVLLVKRKYGLSMDQTEASRAYGTFTVTNDVTRYTKANIFSEVGKRTDCLLRFSTVAGERGAADAERDVRGFAVKFYTEEGNWDMVGNNTPVFFVRDPYKFGDFIHTQKRDPKTNMRSSTAMWDFWSLSPESLHQVTILMSDRGLPRGYRFVNGYRSHTYSFLNAEGERFWIKFHFKTMQGIRTWTNAQAAEIVGGDRESSQRDLFDAIERGEYPQWRVCVQVMPEEEAGTYHVNPFDLTKVWPHGDYPLIEIGIMELNRNPENYFADIEQAAFEPSNIVPGISFSPDKMLQARIMSYADAHRYRIGVNYASLPANKPQCPVHTYHRDGNLRFDGNAGGAVNYEPNSMGGPAEDSRYAEPPLNVTGDADRYDHRAGNDDYNQPGNLFRLMNDDQKEQLFGNIAEAMAGVPERIVVRQLVHFYKADPDYACGVAGKLGLADVSGQVAALASLSLAELVAKTSAEAYTKLQSSPESSLAKAAD